MYSEHTAADFRRHLGLPADYDVEGFLIYGCWDLYAENEQLPLLRQALADLQVPHELRRFTTPALGHAWELRVDGKNYWYVSVMGTAVLAQYLHVACLLGSKRNLLLGIVGGLAKGMRPGDLIVPEAAEGNDNARYYQRSNIGGLYTPNVELSAELIRRLPEAPELWRGVTTTCEMMFAESPADVTAWQAAGRVGVEMEGALTFAASAAFGIPAAALFYVADNLGEAETMLHDEYAAHEALRTEVRQVQYSVGLRTLLQLAE